MTEFYQATPINMPVHKVAGMSLVGLRRVFYDPKAHKIVESIVGRTQGGLLPVEVNSAAHMDPMAVEALRDELTRALDNLRIESKLKRQDAEIKERRKIEDKIGMRL